MDDFDISGVKSTPSVSKSHSYFLECNT